MPYVYVICNLTKQFSLSSTICSLYVYINKFNKRHEWNQSCNLQTLNPRLSKMILSFSFSTLNFIRNFRSNIEITKDYKVICVKVLDKRHKTQTNTNTRKLNEWNHDVNVYVFFYEKNSFVENFVRQRQLFPSTTNL